MSTTENYSRLLARFRKFAECRRDVADRWRAKGEHRVAAQSDAAADFFTRCADELEWTINGETPPAPGCDWPAPTTNGDEGDPRTPSFGVGFQ